MPCPRSQITIMPTPTTPTQHQAQSQHSNLKESQSPTQHSNRYISVAPHTQNQKKIQQSTSTCIFTINILQIKQQRLNQPRQTLNSTMNDPKPSNLRNSPGNHQTSQPTCQYLRITSGESWVRFPYQTIFSSTLKILEKRLTQPQSHYPPSIIFTGGTWRCEVAQACS